MVLWKVVFQGDIKPIMKSTLGKRLGFGNYKSNETALTPCYVWLLLAADMPTLILQTLGGFPISNFFFSFQIGMCKLSQDHHTPRSLNCPLTAKSSLAQHIL